MFDLKGKKALVTGATGGIGKSICKTLVSQGVSLVISGTNQERLEAFKAELGGDVQIITCNLKDKESVKNLAKEAEQALEGIDILVCNAGITKDNLLMRMSEEDFEDVINVNLTSTFVLIKACIRGMMKRKTGRIITIGSVVGTMGNPGQANYVSSKSGLAGLVKSVASEVASRGITVNNIAPGFIQTAMTDALNDDQKSKMLANIPVGQFGQAEDVASTVAFLSSDESKYITGQTLHVNGGMLMV